MYLPQADFTGLRYFWTVKILCNFFYGKAITQSSFIQHANFKYIYVNAVKSASYEWNSHQRLVYVRVCVCVSVRAEEGEQRVCKNNGTIRSDIGLE